MEWVSTKWSKDTFHCGLFHLQDLWTYKICSCQRGKRATKRLKPLNAVPQRHWLCFQSWPISFKRSSWELEFALKSAKLCWQSQMFWIFFTLPAMGATLKSWQWRLTRFLTSLKNATGRTTYTVSSTGYYICLLTSPNSVFSYLAGFMKENIASSRGTQKAFKTHWDLKGVCWYKWSPMIWPCF